MSNQNKWMAIISIFAGIFFFVFIGLAVSYYTSNYIVNPEKAHSADSNKETAIPGTSGKNNKQSKSIASEKSYNIGITEMDFRQKFNKVTAKELSELNLRLTKGYVYNGTYANVYQVPFDNTNSLTISYEPDTELVRGVFLSGHPSNDDEYVLFLGVVAGIVATLNPSLTPSERRGLLQELGMFDGKHTIHQVANLSTYRDNICYSLQGVEGKGTAFIAVANGIEIEGDATVSRDNPHNIMADLTNYLIWFYQNQKSSEEPKEPPKDDVSSDYMSHTESRLNEAKITLRRFHENITLKNYQRAYECLTPNFQAQISYNEWTRGFRTTVRSTVTDIKVFSESPERIVLTYNLEAEDNPGGIQNFSGTTVVVKTMTGWKIDEIINKKR